MQYIFRQAASTFFHPLKPLNYYNVQLFTGIAGMSVFFVFNFYFLNFFHDLWVKTLQR